MRSTYPAATLVHCTYSAEPFHKLDEPGCSIMSCSVRSGRCKPDYRHEMLICRNPVTM